MPSRCKMRKNFVLLPITKFRNKRHFHRRLISFEKKKSISYIDITSYIRMVIPKWQAAREECDSKLGKSRDLEYIIKQKGFRYSSKADV